MAERYERTFMDDLMDQEDADQELLYTDEDIIHNNTNVPHLTIRLGNIWPR